jgi:hypothetical protein
VLNWKPRRLPVLMVLQCTVPCKERLAQKGNGDLEPIPQGVGCLEIGLRIALETKNSVLVKIFRLGMLRNPEDAPLDPAKSGWACEIQQDSDRDRYIVKWAWLEAGNPRSFTTGSCSWVFIKQMHDSRELRPSMPE